MELGRNQNKPPNLVSHMLSDLPGMPRFPRNHAWLCESQMRDALELLLRARALADGSVCVRSDELNILAEILHLRPSDLMISALTREEEVVVRYRSETAPRPYPSAEQPAYLLTDLARTKHQPGLKGFDVTVVDEDTRGAEWLHSLHEYVYNYGNTAVVLQWGEGRTGVIGPGDSAYIRPGVMHRLSRSSGEGEGRVVVVRVPGGLSESVLTEFAAFAADGRSRVGRESTRWF